jgi:DNA-binding response OmpR family regulator
MTDPKITERAHRRGVYVLIVHDEKVTVTPLADALADEFIVRVASSGFEVLERLSATTLTCVVCVLGGTMGARDFYNLVARAAPNQAERVVFVASEAPTGDDEAFLRQRGMNWIAGFDRPEEVVAFVRAVGARR